jgi:hypothetical protein
VSASILRRCFSYEYAADCMADLFCCTRCSPSSSSYSIGHSSNINSIGTRTASNLSGSTTRYKSSSTKTSHVLSISSAVTKLRWRPPADDFLPSADGEEEVDRHDSMLAVATARLTSAGGSGILSLWSIHRPFMPLSVVEGHEKGAVADFVWLQTPQLNRTPRSRSKLKYSDSGMASSKNDSRRLLKKQSTVPNDDAIVIRSSGRGDVDSILFDNKDDEKAESSTTSCIWQHALSVGRDGSCILQSFTRGKPTIPTVFQFICTFP